MGLARVGGAEDGFHTVAQEREGGVESLHGEMVGFRSAQCKGFGGDKGDKQGSAGQGAVAPWNPSRLAAGAMAFSWGRDFGGESGEAYGSCGGDGCCLRRKEAKDGAIT
jgi:hypothetical protein